MPKVKDFTSIGSALTENFIFYITDKTSDYSLTAGELKTFSLGPTGNLFTSTMLDKLSTVADSATENVSDSALRDRTYHTGGQSMGTVSGLSTALAAASAAFSAPANWGTLIAEVNSQGIVDASAAYTNMHSHANVDLLSSVNSTAIEGFSTAYDNTHSHANTALLSAIASAAYSGAVANAHSHANASTLAEFSSVSGMSAGALLTADGAGGVDWTVPSAAAAGLILEHQAFTGDASTAQLLTASTMTTIKSVKLLARTLGASSVIWSVTTAVDGANGLHLGIGGSSTIAATYGTTNTVRSISGNTFVADGTANTSGNVYTVEILGE